MDLILALILACEIGFWLFVVLGLVARYVMRWRRLGAALLTMTLVVDVILLSAVVINLRAGGDASFFHGLAALYLGISIVYGHKMITWADVRFAHRFAHGPAPVKTYGTTYTMECWKDVARAAAAVGIAAAILWWLITIVGNTSSTDELLGIYRILAIWFAIDLIWAISFTVAPKNQPASVR